MQAVQALAGQQPPNSITATFWSQTSQLGSFTVPLVKALGLPAANQTDIHPVMMSAAAETSEQPGLDFRVVAGGDVKLLLRLRDVAGAAIFQSE